METKIFRVVRQGEPVQVPCKSSDRLMWKCSITLRELGGMKADEYVATMLGSDAQCRYREMELVAAKLWFATREHEGRVYQDVMVRDIVKFYGQNAY